MKKNPLSAWDYVEPQFYLRRPWRLITDTWRGLKNFWHRGRYGYSYTDSYNVGYWAPRVIAEALRAMSSNLHTYPGHSPWETPEKWEEHLRELANKFQRCADFLDGCSTDERNEYSKEYIEMCAKTRFDYDKNGILTLVRTPEETELKEKYWARAQKLAEVDRQYARDVFAFFGENLGEYWD